MTDHRKDIRDIALQYANYFDTLSPETISNVHPLVSDDIHFIDPFNDVRGRASLIRVVEKMFEDVKDPKFKILDLAWSEEICLMRWDFSCQIKILGHWTVRGVTELNFDKDGRICAHYDYWDASRHFYGRIPGIGSMLRLISKKAQI